MIYDDTLLVCPYCHEQQLTHEPDDISANMCCTECERCGKTFWYSVEVTREYTSWEDDDEESEDNTDDDPRR